MNQKRHYRRGYPVAILVGFEESYVILWNVFSRVVKQSSKLTLEGKRTDEKMLYNFHQSIVNALKPAIKEGIKSIIITAPQKTSYSSEFLKHIRKHHRYLLTYKNQNKVNLAELEGSANNHATVGELLKSKKFINLLEETRSEEADHLVSVLDRCLSKNENYTSVLYNLKEIENKVYNTQKNEELGADYLLITDKYLAENGSKNRVHRLMQIANNKNIKTRIISVDSLAGVRITQFGGIVFFRS